MGQFCMRMNAPRTQHGLLRRLKHPHMTTTAAQPAQPPKQQQTTTTHRSLHRSLEGNRRRRAAGTPAAAAHVAGGPAVCGGCVRAGCCWSRLARVPGRSGRRADESRRGLGAWMRCRCVSVGVDESARSRCCHAAALEQMHSSSLGDLKQQAPWAAAARQT